MQSHELQSIKTNRKRVGRGGKRGTYSGAGMKGQKARSGAPIKALFEGGRSSLIQRMKKLRGFKSPHAKRVVLSLTLINDTYAEGETVSNVTLIEKGLIRKRDLLRTVRLTGGELTKKLTIDGAVTVSGPAAAVVEKSGTIIADRGEDKRGKRKVPIEKK